MGDSFSGAIRPFPPPPPPDEQAPASPIGARWVAGLGAFLLVAAAATFVTVRWDDIRPELKLAALVAVTSACLVGRRSLRRTLPVTAGALFHLGVLLIPIDVAAVGVHVGWTWSEMLFAQGLTATVVFGVAAQVERSVVLRLAAWVSVVLLAAGVGGMTTLPAGLVLATIAMVLVAGHRGWAARLDADLDLAATGWATLAGLAVPLAGADRSGWPAAGVLVDLGLAGDPLHPLAAVTGLVAGLTLGVVAHRRRSLPLALVGVACGLVGVATSWVSLEPTGSESLLAAAALFLVAELAAWLWRDDPFWRQATDLVAMVGEGLAVTFTLVAAGVVVLAPFELGTDPVAGLGAALLAMAWLTALVRRPAGEERDIWEWTPSAAAVAGAAAVTLWTGSGSAAAVAMTVLGIAVLFGPAAGTSTGPPTGRVLVAGLLGWAPIAGYEDPALAGALAAVGALALAGTAVRAARSPRHARTRTRIPPATFFEAHRPYRGPSAAKTLAGPGWATMLAVVALLPLATGTVVVAADGWGAAAAIGAVGAAWLMAVVLDHADRPAASGVAGGARFSWWRRGISRARPAVGGTPGGWWTSRSPWSGARRAMPDGAGPAYASQPFGGAAGVIRPMPLGLIARVAALVPLAFAGALEPSEAAVLGGVVVGLAVLDAFRLDEPYLVLGAGLGGPVAVVGLTVASDRSLAQAGLGVILSGVAWLGVGGTLPRRWVVPTAACAAIAAVTGLVLSADDPAYLSSGLLVLGGGLAVVGIAVGRTELLVAGLVVGTFGLWGHLTLAEVQVSEPYLAPIALLLLMAGVHARRKAQLARRSLPPVYGATGPGSTSGFVRSPHVSSWVAYAPSVGLLGGAGLVERLDGGPAWHAVVAGAVGVLAVVAGGAWRLAGPLLLGTALLVAVTVHETLDVTATVPTWVWLAIGGSLLLAAGVAMERRGTGPYETGRRLLDLVRERFV